MFDKTTDLCKIGCDGRRKPERFSLLTSLLKNSNVLIRVGALHAGCAVALNTYVKKDGIFSDETKTPKYSSMDTKMQQAFDVANAQHVYNSLALMAAPIFSRNPGLTGGLLLSGITLFCGSQYYRTLKNRETSVRIPSYLGCICLLGGWFSFLL